MGPTPWRALGKLTAALLAVGVLVAGLLLPYVGGMGLVAQHEADRFLGTTCNLTDVPPPRATTLYASDAKTVIATLFQEDRVPIPLSQLPRYVITSLLATEDRRFYQDHGVDMRSLIRAAIDTSGGDLQGGSTLTMQYVKQLRYYQAIEQGNMAAANAAIAPDAQRKMDDAQCAIAFSKHESKNEILDNYLNIAYFGENAYGIQVAAETYYGEPASRLALPQAAMLVGLLRAPSYYDPFLHPEQALARRNEVLQNLVTVGQLTPARAQAYEAVPISLATEKPPAVREGCKGADRAIANVGFFCDYAVSWLEHTQGLSSRALDAGGYKIVTTLDAGTQNTIQRRLDATIPAASPMTAIIPVVDPRSGNVLAMATSKRYGNPTSGKDHTHTELPVFTSYTGSGASTYKLFPLLTALSTGIPGDWPLRTTDPYHAADCTTPSTTRNGDASETYDATETLASATAKSENTYFVELVDQILSCNLAPVVTMAQRLGMSGLDRPGDVPGRTIAQTIIAKQRSQQLVLGDIPTSPLQLAGAYAGVADDGRFNPPAPILSITSPGGHAIAVKRTPPTQVVSPQVARQAVQILTGDTTSTYPGTSATPFRAWYARNPSLVAGKTGTEVARNQSQNGTIWFVGMTPGLVAATELVDLADPFAPSSGLPGEKAAGTAYGDYASGVWVSTIGPVLAGQTWTWPSPDAVAGRRVPDPTGKSLADAKRLLSAAGYTMAQLDSADGVACASTRLPGQVAYYAPQIAPPGARITVCPSNGLPQPGL